MPDLRHGSWTRLGGDSLLGDRVTEGVLGGLAEKVRSASQAQGYATGWAAGRREAAAAAEVENTRLQQEYDAREARRAAEHDAAMQALHRAATELRAAVGASVATVEDRAAELAFEVTATLLGREVASVTSAEVLARALAVLPEGAVATVRLHPAVVSAVETADAAVELVADPALGRADALVELPDGGVIDLRIATALDRLREVLS